MSGSRQCIVFSRNHKSFDIYLVIETTYFCHKWRNEEIVHQKYSNSCIDVPVYTVIWLWVHNVHVHVCSRCVWHVLFYIPDVVYINQQCLDSVVLMRVTYWFSTVTFLTPFRYNVQLHFDDVKMSRRVLKPNRYILTWQEDTRLVHLNYISIKHS